MPGPLRLLQRVLITLRYKRLELFDRDYRGAQRWCREGFALSLSELEARQMQRLRDNVAGYRALGLCSESIYDDANLQRWSDLARLPVLTRARMQEEWPKLQAALAGQPVHELRTTGTTGIKVRFFRTKGVEKANEGFYIELAKMMGYHPSMTHIVIWANDEATGLRRAYFGRFSRLLYPRLVFRGYTTSSAEFERLYRSVMDNPGCCISGYTGMLAACANELIRRGLKVPAGHVGCLCGGAEMMGPKERSVLEEAFGIRPHDMYGSREVHQAAWDCEHGTMHINPRLIPEVVSADSGEPLPEGQTGLLLFTDLFNPVTPFIRYQIGDYGAIARTSDCPCGRRGWALSSIQGRSAEVVRLADGTLASPMLINRLLFTFPQITNYQLIRRGESSFVLRYCGTPLSSEDAAKIHSGISGALSGSELVLEHSSELQVKPGGKLSYYIDETEGNRDQGSGIGKRD